MNGIRTTGVGVALALAAPGFAQTSAPEAPAATLRRAVAIDAPSASPVVRAAPPDTRPTSLFPAPSRFRQDPPSGGSTPLPMGKPVDGQPNVTESRTPPMGTAPGTGVPMQGVPMQGVPMQGSPFIPGAYPPPGYQLSPAHAAPHAPGGFVPTSPAPAYTLPGHTLAPTVSGPVVTNPPGAACDPYAGATTLATPVAPSPPGIGGYEGGLYTSPAPASPYWAGGWDPLFPRARAVASSLIAPFTQGR
ncbi:MAG: hypothetical protein MUF18_19450, partial [Fimbriiglobus sp.]|nr:hypothetical protein [Fimbriiglobus sp.]